MRISDWSSDVCSSDLEAAAGDRLEDVLADHAPVARIVGVYRDRHVGEHRFGARRRDDDMVAPVIECHAVGEWIFEVPEAALHLVRLDLEVADRRLELRSEEHTSELQSLMRISYAVFCL